MERHTSKRSTGYVTSWCCSFVEGVVMHAHGEPFYDTRKEPVSYISVKNEQAISNSFLCLLWE